MNSFDKSPDYDYECSSCINRCDGKSKGIYLFNNDVEFSESRENQLIKQINSVEGFFAQKCEKDGYPDIEIEYLPTGKRFFIEVKVQRRTFMAIERLLPDADLTPSQTMALNLSDLVRYFQIHDKERKPVFILWCLLERPCVVPEGQTQYYYQDIERLREIYYHYGDARRFKRKSGYGDIVNGQHKGVVVNYHFGLQELMPFRISHILELMKNSSEET